MTDDSPITIDTVRQYADSYDTEEERQAMHAFIDELEAQSPGFLVRSWETSRLIHNRLAASDQD